MHFSASGVDVTAAQQLAHTPCMHRMSSRGLVGWWSEGMLHVRFAGCSVLHITSAL
jgi:hypothetical protein